MPCAHAHVPPGGGDGIFTVDASSLAFGRGAIDELGDVVAGLGGRRVAIFTDRRVAELPIVADGRAALATAGIDAVVYDRVAVEPTDASFMDAARFARDGRFDAYVSIGGGSTIDTCKAAALYATHPADFLAYVNAPIGEGRSVPGPLPPHVACPTTCGTGSELTGIAVCDVLALGVKTGIASRHLRPTRALVDPDATRTLPGTVVAASGFDVLAHAFESYTARPHGTRTRPAHAAERPMSQGRNPWSDIGCREALRLAGAHLVRAVTDASDDDARAAMAWAATLAGLAFGNAGVHLPHAMAYAVAGGVKDFRMAGYPPEAPLVPHGISVITSAPAAFRFTAPACPERHLEAARALGADASQASLDDAGAIVTSCLTSLMRACAVPLGLGALGYGEADVPALVRGTMMQRRLLDNAPCAIDARDVERVFRDAEVP